VSAAAAATHSSAKNKTKKLRLERRFLMNFSLPEMD